MSRSQPEGESEPVAGDVRGPSGVVPQADARLVAALDAMLDPALWLSTHRDGDEVVDFVVEAVNGAAERLLGAKAADLVGRLLCELRPNVRSGGFFERYRRVAASGEPLEEEFATDAGRWLRERVVRVGDGVVVVSRDVSEARTAEARLRQSERLASLGVLLAGVAHEINNPITYTLANLEAVAEVIDQHRRAGDGEEGWLDDVAGAVAEALAGAGRVRDVVRDLRTFSRPTTGSATVRASDVSTVVEAAVRMAGHEVKHRAALVKDMAEVPPVAMGESRLGQVLINLLVNAAQALGSAPADRNTIRINVLRAGPDRVAVEVVDNGPGMEPEVAARAFDPFFTTKPAGAGTGIGLAVCKSLVEAAGGIIEVESALGEGTTFRLLLPVATAEANRSRATHARGAPARRTRVLVLDDEPLVGRALARLIGDEHDVTSATSAREVLARVDAGERFDVLLCDVLMPEMSGMEFFVELNARVPELAARVVFVTGGLALPDVRAFLEPLSNRVLEKPVDSKRLRAILEGVAHERGSTG